MLRNHILWGAPTIKYSMTRADWRLPALHGMLLALRLVVRARFMLWFQRVSEHVFCLLGGALCAVRADLGAVRVGSDDDGHPGRHWVGRTISAKENHAPCANKKNGGDPPMSHSFKGGGKPPHP